MNNNINNNNPKQHRMGLTNDGESGGGSDRRRSVTSAELTAVTGGRAGGETSWCSGSSRGTGSRSSGSSSRHNWLDEMKNGVVEALPARALPGVVGPSSIQAPSNLAQSQLAESAETSGEQLSPRASRNICLEYMM
eukprot:GHVS01069316.1.p2 GENE.GHVS01069316.1~~GHVS01069316.1.p2  ORF type:complete len:136 (-),score=40.33 GHVS01069316.1:313-720(-)